MSTVGTSPGGARSTDAPASPRAARVIPRPPFDFAQILGYLARSPLEPLDVVAEGTYQRAVRLAGRPVLVEIANAGSVDAPALDVRALAIGSHDAPDPAAGQPDRARPEPPTALDAPTDPAAREAARWLRADEDPRDLEAIAAADPVVGRLLALLRGARAPIMPSPFEALIWAILGQQINLPFAYRLKRALVER
jgi:DNA-3-methyladenine glycosylase II